MAIAGDFVKHVACGRDRIGAQEDFAIKLHAGGDETPSECLVACDIPVRAGLDLCGGHDEGSREEFRRFAEGVSRFERADIAFENFALELASEPSFRRVHRPAVKPAEHTEGKKVLAPVDVTGTQVEANEGLAIERREGNFDQVVAVAQFRKRVAFVAGALLCLLVERVDIDDHHAAGANVVDIRA